MKKLLLITLFLAQVAYAQEAPLIELKKSKEFTKIQNKIKIPEGSLPPGVNPDGSYAKIFATKNGYSLIQDWIGKPSSFRVGPAKGSLRQDVLEYSQNFLYDRDKVLLRIIIPKPNLLEAAEFKLVAEVLQFQAPTLSIIAEEKIPLQKSIEGDFLIYNKNSCGVRIKLPRESILFISSSECQKKELLTQLADELAIEILKNKLSE